MPHHQGPRQILTVFRVKKPCPRLQSPHRYPANLIPSFADCASHSDTHSPRADLIRPVVPSQPC